MNGTQALLSVRDVHAHYGKSHILHGVTFEVGPNEVVSLLGRNGSGRSTTMKPSPRECEMPPRSKSPITTTSFLFIEH